ncbi:MAG: hypothetical protein CMM32_04955 [Rhodospirillaceae bacterium]|nr:hypothetical protein [Rhodospirillaceae bacterium]|tara:strand:+ start:1289 stop:2059 length:771 start_codon:yes stop_codon:yes gene_type:complete
MTSYWNSKNQKLAICVLIQLLIAGRCLSSELPVDLSKHNIAIHSSFTGSNVVLFGVQTAPEDEGSNIIAVLSGPTQNVVVRKKRKTIGIWLNRSEAVFQNIPGYYAVASTGPINKLLELEVLLQHQIGVNNVVLSLAGAIEGRDYGPYKKALVRHKVQQGLYFAEPAAVDLVQGGLFRIHFTFPSNVPPGTYRAKVYEVKKGKIISEGGTQLSIRKAGLEARIYQTAQDSPWIYGILAVVLALLSGWLAGAVFRRA